MLLDSKDDWLAARLEDLDYGDIDGIREAARVYPLRACQWEAICNTPHTQTRTA